MKKRMILLSFTAISYYACGSAESDQIVGQMVDAGSQAFGSFKMFDAPLDDRGLWKWNAAINAGQKIIAGANKKNKQVSDYSARIDKANNMLIHAIADAYNSLFVPFEHKSELSDAEKRNFKTHYDKFKNIFGTIQDDMHALIKQLKNTGFFETSISKKDVIIAIADTIVRYAQNASTSLEFKVSSDTKFSREKR